MSLAQIGARFGQNCFRKVIQSEVEKILPDTIPADGVIEYKGARTSDNFTYHGRVEVDPATKAIRFVDLKIYDRPVNDDLLRAAGMAAGAAAVGHATPGVNLAMQHMMWTKASCPSAASPDTPLLPDGVQEMVSILTYDFSKLKGDETGYLTMHDGKIHVSSRENPLPI